MTVMILFPLEQLASDLGKWLKTIRFFGKTNLSPCKYMHIIFCKQSMQTKHCSINYCIHLSFSFLDPLFPTNLINVAGWGQTIEFVRSLSTNTDPQNIVQNFVLEKVFFFCTVMMGMSDYRQEAPDFWRFTVMGQQLIVPELISFFTYRIPTVMFDSVDKHCDGKWLNSIKAFFNLKKLIYSEILAMSPKFYW